MMNIADLFVNIKRPLKKEELSDFTKENYTKLTKGEDYEAIVKSIIDTGLNVNNLYISDEQLFPFWYIEDCAYMEVHHLSTEIDEGIFGWKHIKSQVEKTNELLRGFLEEEDYETFFVVVNERFSFDLFVKMIDEIPKDRVYDAFKNIYISNDYGFGDLDKKHIEYIFQLNQCDEFKTKLKTDDGYVSIYRGIGNKSTNIDKAYSWTLNLSTAIFFASRFDITSPIIYEAKIHIDDIVDYIKDRGEAEILLLPESLLEPKVLSFYNLNELMKMDVEAPLTFYNYYKGTIDKKWFKNADGIHGVLHTKRVLFLSLFIGNLEGVSNLDFDVLIFSSLYHDIGRTNDDKDDYHGSKSLKKLAKEKDSALYLSDEDFNIAKFIIKNHSLDDNVGEQNLEKEENITDKKRALKLYRIFKDADNLDRVRFKGLDTNYLRTESAKKLPLVAWQLLNGLK